jgi:hypothetical protein
MSLDPALLETDSLKVLNRVFSAPDLPPGLVSRRHEAFAEMYTVLAGCYWHARRRRDAVRCAVRALVLSPQIALYIADYPRRLAARLLRGQSARPWPWSDIRR